MRCTFTAAAFLLTSVLAFAQTPTGHDRLNEVIAALGAATADPVRDSLNKVLKSELRTRLEADDALSASFTDLRLSRVDAPDGRFRLFTWNIPYADGHHGFEGLLLVQEKKQAVLHELRDGTPSIPSPGSVELGPENWYGAVYYDVAHTVKGGKHYYTLLGWKGYSKVETRKVIDVLSFKGGRPRLGAPLFGEGRIRKHREVFGYSFQASMTLKWDPVAGRIWMDHLSPTRPDMEGQWAYYGPDLSYDAYVWERDHWVFQRDIDLRDLDRNNKPFNAPPQAPRR